MTNKYINKEEISKEVEKVRKLDLIQGRGEFLVKRIEIKQETYKGTTIVIPDTHKEVEDPKNGIGVVLLVTSQILNNGKLRALEVKVGDIVNFSNLVGAKVEFNKEFYILLKEKDINFILED